METSEFYIISSTVKYLEIGMGRKNFLEVNVSPPYLQKHLDKGLLLLIMLT